MILLVRELFVCLFIWAKSTLLRRVHLHWCCLGWESHCGKIFHREGRKTLPRHLISVTISWEVQRKVSLFVSMLQVREHSLIVLCQKERYPWACWMSSHSWGVSFPLSVSWGRSRPRQSLCVRRQEGCCRERTRRHVEGWRRGIVCPVMIWYHCRRETLFHLLPPDGGPQRLPGSWRYGDKGWWSVPRRSASGTQGHPSRSLGHSTATMTQPSCQLSPERSCFPPSRTLNSPQSHHFHPRRPDSHSHLDSTTSSGESLILPDVCDTCSSSGSVYYQERVDTPASFCRMGRLRDESSVFSARTEGGSGCYEFLEGSEGCCKCWCFVRGAEIQGYQFVGWLLECHMVHSRKHPG